MDATSLDSLEIFREAVFMWSTPLDLAFENSFMAVTRAFSAVALSFFEAASATILVAVLTLDFHQRLYSALERFCRCLFSAEAWFAM